MTDDVVGRSVANAVIELGKLVLQLGRVDRVTYHPDGKTLESDTDHTVMLGLIAPAFAARFMPKLDLGKVAQYAIVHDLVEAYSGDVNTLTITLQGHREKEARELEAAQQIEADFGLALPWVPDMIWQYRSQSDLESRYVWAMDKILPKITHILNGGTTVQDSHVTRHDMARRLARQTRELQDRVGTMDPVMELYAVMKGLMFEHVYGT